jgi:deoxycytidine triphosphate deaminase
LPPEPEERLVVSRERGKLLAEGWRRSPGVIKVPDTLLSSQYIVDVVEATGLIAPFYVGNFRKSRLKKATYEGRVGEKAFIYNRKNIPERIFDRSTDEFLKVPKNSIVFAESDLDFRLPDFIALRFNLQIRHVHRGLLLGTGPLVDPGFWGKLCIPLHNLTDEDYLIPKDEGLIWIEFTKTALSVKDDDPARRPLDGDGNWNIEEFLSKAANQYTGEKIPIRSSLPEMFAGATLAAKRAAEDAGLAKKDAEKALESADKMRNYNFYAMIASAAGILSVCIAAAVFIWNISARNEDIAGRLQKQVAESADKIDGHLKIVDDPQARASEAVKTLEYLRQEAAQRRKAISVLENQVKTLTRDVEQLSKPKDPNRPAG